MGPRRQPRRSSALCSRSRARHRRPAAAAQNGGAVRCRPAAAPRGRGLPVEAAATGVPVAACAAAPTGRRQQAVAVGSRRGTIEQHRLVPRRGGGQRLANAVWAWAPGHHRGLQAGAGGAGAGARCSAIWGVAAGPARRGLLAGHVPSGANTAATGFGAGARRTHTARLHADHGADDVAVT